MYNTESTLKYDFSSFEYYYNPVLAIDNQGIIVYKNEITKAIDSFRQGTKLEKYIVEQDKPLLKENFEGKRATVLTLQSRLKGSKVFVFPFDGTDYFLAVVILSSHLISYIPFEKHRKTENQFYADNIETLKRLKKQIISLNYEDDLMEKHQKLLFRNTQLLSRAERHFNLYLGKTNKTIKSEKEIQMIDLSQFVREIYQASLAPCASLGYRITLNCDDHIYHRIRRLDFICAFLSLVSSFLRIADERLLSINLYEGECPLFLFTFTCKNYEEKMSCLSNEINFISNVISLLGWKFDIKSDSSNEISVYVTLDKLDNSSLYIQSNDDEYDFRGGIKHYIDIIESELSVLYED